MLGRFTAMLRHIERNAVESKYLTNKYYEILRLRFTMLRMTYPMPHSTQSDSENL